MPEENTQTDETEALVADGSQSQADNADDRSGSGGDQETPEALRAKLTKSVDAEKTARKRAQEAEQKLSQREKADLTEQQKLERDRDETKARAETLESENRSLRVQLVAAQVGVKPDLVEAAATYVKWDDIDDPSDSKQLERHLRQIVKDRPSLAGTIGGGDGGESRRSGGSSMTDVNTLIRQAAGRPG